MEFTELEELNDMIIYSKSYRPSLIPKFTKYFDFDFKAPQDLNFVSFDELLDNSFEDLPSPEIQHKTSQKINVPEKSNETIDDIIEDISNSVANFVFNVSPGPSPKKIEDPVISQQMKPIEEEEEHKLEESPENNEKNIQETKIEEANEENNKEMDPNENREEEKKTGSFDDKKNFLKIEKDNISQTYTEKRKLTSCLTENIKQNKGPVKFHFLISFRIFLMNLFELFFFIFLYFIF
jgi:hypothetical protein